MIRIFGPGDKEFTSNGDVVLAPLKAKVHKADNADFYLDIEAGLEYADSLVEDNIIIANTPQGDQAFRIGNPTKTKSKITLKAWHVYYDAENHVIVKTDVQNKTCGAAMNQVNSASYPQSPFTVSSDVSTVQSYVFEKISLDKAINAILSVWGGHLVRDNFEIRIVDDISVDNGITVQYQKNLKDITVDENWDDVCTVCFPIGKDGITLNALDQSANAFVQSQIQYAIPYTKMVSFDQDIKQEDFPTEAAYKAALISDLRAKAQAYVDSSYLPAINYTLKAHLDHITDVGEQVEVIDERFGIHFLASVISYDYDCILEKYTEIEFGTFKKSLSELIGNITSSVDKSTNIELQNLMAAITASRNVMTRTSSLDVDSLTASANTIIPFDLSNAVGYNLLADEDGGIKIGPGVNKVLVSGFLSFSTVDSAGNRRVSICKGTTATVEATTTAYFAASRAGTIEITPMLIDVAEDDVIYLCYNTPDADDVISSTGTALTVQVIA